jgi:hypothetical protein
MSSIIVSFLYPCRFLFLRQDQRITSAAVAAVLLDLAGIHTIIIIAKYDETHVPLRRRPDGVNLQLRVLPCVAEQEAKAR